MSRNGPLSGSAPRAAAGPGPEAGDRARDTPTYRDAPRRNCQDVSRAQPGLSPAAVSALLDPDATLQPGTGNGQMARELTAQPQCAQTARRRR